MQTIQEDFTQWLEDKEAKQDELQVIDSLLNELSIELQA